MHLAYPTARALMLLLLLLCRLYAAPGALGGVLAYVGLNYDKLETWVTEFGTNMLDEQLLDPEAVSDTPSSTCCGFATFPAPLLLKQR